MGTDEPNGEHRGLMEYSSMYFGFAFLYLLAIGFYLAARWRPGAVLQPRRAASA
jgi:hypothetical protein